MFDCTTNNIITSGMLPATGALDLPAYLPGHIEWAVVPTLLPVPPGRTRVYRAVSEAEYQDIRRTGRFRTVPHSMEGKWFADSVEDARAHGEALPFDGPYRLIEADVPADAPNTYHHHNIDGRGRGRFLHIDELQDTFPRLLE